MADGLPNSDRGGRVWALGKVLTHRLKGRVSYCGTSRLGEICLKLESAIKDGQNGLWEGLYQQLLSEISLAEKTIKKEEIANIKS